MLFHAPAYEVAEQAREGALSVHLRERFIQKYGFKPSASETGFWGKSIPALSSVLLDAGLEHVDMMIEYELPLTSTQVDVILAGVHPKSGQHSYIVIEMKQWSSAEPEDGNPLLCRVGTSTRPMLNPIEQVRRYRDYLASANESLIEHPERIAGAAYLYNATEYGISGLREGNQSTHSRLFSGERRGDFISFLKEHLAPESGTVAADELLTARIRPSSRLMTVAADEVRKRERFTLLDEQFVAYERVLGAVRKAQRSHSKEVVIITGGPGTGKSAIGLALLGEFHRRGLTTMHATGSAAFTRAMRKVVGSGSNEVRKLFTYFNSFADAGRSSIDVLICDEAQRIRETSTNRFTPASQRTGKPQVEELIDAAQVSVFLLDELQAVHPGELGTVDMIRTAAETKGLNFQIVTLGGDFRSGGSYKYLRWVTQLLNPPKDGPLSWEPDGLMKLRTADSPRELEVVLDEQRSCGHTARMTAAYCWPWSFATPEEPLPNEVAIGDWARPWNLKGERSVMGAPPAALWAIDPAGFGQVGSIYTAQGFEYDWNGVIMGPDLVWRNDAWIVDRAASKDPAFSRKTISDSDVERLILNTYKVLLTRGNIGTVIYSTDAETRAKLRELIRTPAVQA
ncbi:DNA/RNA helicase domain-containing protein [Streptomyces sp. NPDC020141]|uniref:DNA/RNA helicase domain-containing protein n=1 Tax=Streptomyces sp. NPDC020141 TaxID=3365065 RepID=UPI0037B39451